MRCMDDEIDDASYSEGLWHAWIDATLGPCLIDGCPGSVFAQTDLEELWLLDPAETPR